MDSVFMASGTFQPSQESRLVTDMMDRYKHAGTVPRPIYNSSGTIRVAFALALIQILDFDETNQVLTTNVWKRYKWKDEILVWNPDDYGGIDDIRVSSASVWTPDVVLYNNADIQEKEHQEYVAVYHNGSVRWIPPAIYKSSCKVDMRNFPFDEQSCYLKFGSWTYDGRKLDLEFYDNFEDFDTREYITSSEWMVLKTAAEYHVRYYPCCGDEPYPDITFYLTIKRKTAFYVYVLILPSILLSFLTLILFWIPPQRPDRTSLGMSLFSSFFVLLLILVQSSPPTSDSISLLGLYYCINMVLIAFSTMLSAMVINITHYLQKKPVPYLAKLFLIKGLGRVLCAQSEPPIGSPLRDDYVIPEDEIPIRYLPKQRSNGSDSNNRLRHGRVDQSEWRVIASVMDRIFFVLYVVGMVMSVIFVFPR